MIHKAGRLPSRVLKRSIKIADRKTSTSLEDGFWRALREIAVAQNLRVAKLVSRIDKDRQNKNLSSAIRVFVLEHYRKVASDRHQGLANKGGELGSAVTLGSLRQLGVRGLLLICLDRKCRHEATMGVDDYPDEIELPSFAPRMVCSKCGGKQIDVRPNWKEMPIMPPKLRLD
jgi:predicted DNA-binding ribbon-helix-helix protein